MDKKSKQITEVSKIKSNVDGRFYLVRVEKDSQEAANLLGYINKNLLKLIDFLKKEHPDDERTKRLIKKYNPESLSEGTENENYTSYSINKGEKIVFCLRMRDAENNLVDKNTLKYVAIHELAHVATKEIGHIPIFWYNFKWMLSIAKDNNIYEYVDYKKNPQPYCGLLISSNILDS